jgi:hypothetical protein
MVGTSTGGLIALMAGRLKMSVGAALEAYNDVAKEAFHTETRSRLNRLKTSNSQKTACLLPRPGNTG